MTWSNTTKNRDATTTDARLLYKGVDVMKKTKDVITNQLTTEEKINLVQCIKSIGATHIAISVPMDIQSEFVAFGSTPSPRIISHEVQEWCDIIHDNGLRVIHRGVFCGVEAIWSAGYFDGSIATGTAASAATDGTSTLCGRYYLYLYTNVGISHVADGDIFSPIPEGTGHAFDGHYFWTGGTQANYADVYAKFHAITTAFGTAAGKDLVFLSCNNFSEVRSGWLPASVMTDEGLCGFDYYGRYQGSTSNQVSDYVTDLNAVYAARAKPMFFGEWGDISGNALPTSSTIFDRLEYLIKFYTTLHEKFVRTGKLVGYNYWGGWEGQNTSILFKTGSGSSSKYFVNARGQILRSFFEGNVMKTLPRITGGSSELDFRF